MRRLTAVYEYSDGHWLVEIKEMPYVHTYGTSVQEAQKNIQETLTLWLEKEEYEQNLVVVHNLNEKQGNERF